MIKNKDKVKKVNVPNEADYNGVRRELKAR